MRIFGAALGLALFAGSAGAQIVPLGAPIIPRPKTQAAPAPAQDQSGRIKAAKPIGSNYSPYSLQPLGSVTASAPSSYTADGPTSSGVVSDLNAPPPSNAAPKPAKPKNPADQSDMQKLAPKAPDRTELPTADSDNSSAPAPR